MKMQHPPLRESGTVPGTQAGQRPAPMPPGPHAGARPSPAPVVIGDGAYHGRAGRPLPSQQPDLARANRPLASLQAELVSRNARLTASNGELDGFAHAMAHDLKEPIRGVRMLASFIAEDAGGTLDAASAVRLKKIDCLCAQVLGEIDAALSAARAGGSVTPPQPVSVAELAADAMQGVLALSADRHAVITCDVAAHQAIVRVERAQAARALRNLITNAVKHNTSPYRRVAVGIRLTPAPDALAPGRSAAGPSFTTVTVTDNGDGITPQQAERHAVPYIGAATGAAPLAREDPIENSDSGLAIARRIVGHYRGTLWVEPHPAGRGSVFCFTLPSA